MHCIPTVCCCRFISELYVLYFSSHVVFGHVVDGESYIEQIEKTTVDDEHKPYSDFRIADCGLVPGYGAAVQPPPIPNPNEIPMLGPGLFSFLRLRAKYVLLFLRWHFCKYSVNKDLLLLHGEIMH